MRINVQNEENVEEKICFVGNQSFGKTSIVSCYLYIEFPYKHSPKIGSTSTNKNDGLHIWNTAGLLKYRMLIPMYIMHTSVILIIFDISDRSAFDALNE